MDTFCGLPFGPKNKNSNLFNRNYEPMTRENGTYSKLPGCIVVKNNPTFCDFRTYPPCRIV